MSTTCLNTFSIKRKLKHIYSLQCEEFKIQADAVKEGLVETYPVPCDVVRNSDIIFSCLSGPKASKDVSQKKNDFIIKSFYLMVFFSFK